MKFVREHIIFEKFTQNSDPIHDMGIGISKIIEDSIKNMFKYDYNRLLIQKDHNTFRNLRTEWSITSMDVEPSAIIINFYSNRYYKKNKKEINKIDYARELFKNANISDFIGKLIRAQPEGICSDIDYSYPYHLTFNIKPRYRKYFTPGTYYPKDL